MKNLENYGVQEMNAAEIETVNAGDAGVWGVVSWLNNNVLFPLLTWSVTVVVNATTTDEGGGNCCSG